MFSALSNQRLKIIGCLLALDLFLPACRQNLPAAAPAVKTVGDWFAIKSRDRTVQMQLAIFPVEMEHGLMGRSDLGATRDVFWLPRTDADEFLDAQHAAPIGYWILQQGGRVEGNLPMLPYDEKTIRSRSEALEFALEMNQGWFRSRGVKPGAMLDLAALKDALKARGVAPEEFGLR